jgi:hypothetical protein
LAWLYLAIERAGRALRRGTIAWKLQREIILLLGWGPAIFCSSSRIRSWLAAWPTTVLFAPSAGTGCGLLFKTERQALAVVARINAIHDWVNGRLTEAAGIPPGHPLGSRS